MRIKKTFYSRREFMGCLGVAFFSFPRLFKHNPSESNFQEKEIYPPRISHLSSVQKRSRVVIVEGEDINRLIWKGMEAMELPEDFFKGKKVVVKPNTHWSELYPSTTDPVSIMPVIDFLREKKSSSITVADGSGVDLPNYRAAFGFIGFEKILASKKVDIVPLDIWKLDDFVSVKNTNWNTLYESIGVHKLIYHAPILISMTCLKRHGSPHLTAALKNNIGAISARSRYRVHYRTRGKIREAIAEVADAVHPEITIIDARDIMVKSGPIFLPDKSNLKRGINKVLISSDPAALDTVAAQIMAEHDDTFHLNQFQPTLDHANELELGNIDPKFIEVVNLRI